MGSTGSERSLSSGLIPQWMKSKIDSRLDLDDSVNFSPPDDSFFYIHYNTSTKRVDGNSGAASNSNGIKARDVGYRPISQILKEEPLSTTLNIPEKVPKFAQHTVPCQQYIAQSGIKADIPKTKQSQSGSIGRIKSAGTDDGFKGEAAACGTSIIQVANQMVSASSLTRGFQSTSFDTQCPTPNIHNVHPDDLPPKGFNPQLRRGSKSLPTTPLASPNSSPRSRRKHNRYFTGAFVDRNNQTAADTKYQGSWILAGLLGTREILSRSTTAIAEEEISTSVSSSSAGDTLRKAYSKVDVSNVNMEETDISTKKQSPSTMFLPKPSELREMNFWSPTSM